MHVFADKENMPPISEEMFNVVRVFLPKGKTLLELGSGSTTAEFAKYYNVISVEHNPEFIGKFNKRENYILSTNIKNSFYEPSELKANLPVDYDALLVDGPDTDFRMDGFLECLDLFKKDVPWFLDDLSLGSTGAGIRKLPELTGRQLIQFVNGAKKFAVLLGDGK